MVSSDHFQLVDNQELLITNSSHLVAAIRLHHSPVSAIFALTISPLDVVPTLSLWLLQHCSSCGNMQQVPNTPGNSPLSCPYSTIAGGESSGNNTPGQGVG